MNNSHKTAITRSKPSAPMNYLHGEGLLLGHMLDYGCGKGFDADHFKMDKFDPHFTKGEVYRNDGFVYYLTDLRDNYDTITCNYVLNVIESVHERTEVLNNIRYLLKPGGVAYITIRRDAQVAEGCTSKGTYQESVALDLPIEHEKKGGYIIYRMEK